MANNMLDVDLINRLKQIRCDIEHGLITQQRPLIIALCDLSDELLRERDANHLTIRNLEDRYRRLEATNNANIATLTRTGYGACAKT